MPLVRAALAALVLLAACGNTKSSVELINVMQPSDGGAVDPALCAGLDECACSATPGCMPLTTACYCPPAACGSTASCACTGGRYLGCNPRGAGCFPRCSLFAEPSPRDDRGCVGCVDSPDCASAVAKLPAVCPSAPPVDAKWLCDDASLGPCTTSCVNQLDTCASASCALDEGGICPNDLFDACLLECLMAQEHG